MKDIEIEIQVNIEKTKPLIGFLKNNAELKGEKHQIDEYFSPPHRDFVEQRPVKEWLRLRNSEGSFSINYKHWYFDKEGRSHHCKEYETKIESVEQMKKVFKALNFKHLVRVDKKRKIWTYKNYEITLDSIRNLGDFVEIEYKGKKNADPKKITEEMVQLLKNLGCGRIKRNYVGYPFQLLFPKEVKYEEL